MSHAKLLDIAVREFGLRGLEGASTRGIAAAAGTAMSSITYHYGGKEGLYLAAADHIAAGMATEMVPIIAAERAISSDDVVGARAAVHRILAHFVDKMCNDVGADRMLFMLREQMNPGAAFDRIYDGVMGQVMARLADLVCVASGVAGQAARVATITLMGQAIVVRASRASVLRLLGVDAIDEAIAATLKTRIAANIDAILDRMIAEQETP